MPFTLPVLNSEVNSAALLSLHIQDNKWQVWTVWRLKEAPAMRFTDGRKITNRYHSMFL